MGTPPDMFDIFVRFFCTSSKLVDYFFVLNLTLSLGIEDDVAFYMMDGYVKPLLIFLLSFYAFYAYCSNMAIFVVIYTFYGEVLFLKFLRLLLLKGWLW